MYIIISKFIHNFSLFVQNKELFLSRLKSIIFEESLIDSQSLDTRTSLTKEPVKPEVPAAVQTDNKQQLARTQYISLITFQLSADLLPDK